MAVTQMAAATYSEPKFALRHTNVEMQRKLHRKWRRYRGSGRRATNKYVHLIGSLAFLCLLFATFIQIKLSSQSQISANTFHLQTNQKPTTTTATSQQATINNLFNHKLQLAQRSARSQQEANPLNAGTFVPEQDDNFAPQFGSQPQLDTSSSSSEIIGDEETSLPTTTTTASTLTTSGDENEESTIDTNESVENTPEQDQQQHNNRQQMVQSSSGSSSSFEGIHLRPLRELTNDGVRQVVAGATNFVAQNSARFPTTTTTRQQQVVNNNNRPLVVATSSTPANLHSFDVNMGADRMLIKPPTRTADQYAVTTFPSNRQPPASLQEQLATESVSHHVHAIDASPVVNERRQDDPSSSLATVVGTDIEAPTMRQHASYIEPQLQQQGVSNQQQRDDALVAGQAASICYTPLSLLTVVLITILITLAVCYCAHYLIKHLNRRRQFDLVENSKQFDHKHSTTTNDTHHACARHPNGQQQTPIRPVVGCSLHLFHRNSQCNKCAQQLVTPSWTRHNAPATTTTTLSECATFNNPYFSDAYTSPELHRRQQRTYATCSNGGNDDNDDDDDLHKHWTQDKHQTTGGPLLVKANVVGAPATSVEHLHSVESHIASLHNKQVTSSVKELSILGQQHESTCCVGGSYLQVAAQHEHQVVDLTSDEQRARVIANPREGDLVAVDISGHDIIGLGLNVCGNQRDGIFIKSVSSHGPAKQSGCIQAGDRIKCLNISFENVTLQDACDLLNCGSPYKMRLLIEKKAIVASELNKLRDTSLSQSTAHHHHKQNIPSGHAYDSNQSIEATCNNSRAHLYQTRAPSTTSGPLDTTKTYLRRVKDKLLGAPSDVCSGATNERATSGDYFNQLALRISSTSPESSAPLGSLAARQQYSNSSRRARITRDQQAGHVNEAFYDATDLVGARHELAERRTQESNSTISSQSSSTTTRRKARKLQQRALTGPQAGIEHLDVTNLSAFNGGGDDHGDDDDDQDCNAQQERRACHTTNARQLALSSASDDGDDDNNHHEEHDRPKTNVKLPMSAREHSVSHQALSRLVREDARDHNDDFSTACMHMSETHKQLVSSQSQPEIATMTCSTTKVKEKSVTEEASGTVS